MSDDGGIKFGNDHAMRELLKVLTDGFTRMSTVAEQATTPQVALHEAVATANAAFTALPLPVGDGVLQRRALDAHQSHLRLLRTLAAYEASKSDSRATYDARVRQANETSNEAREALVFAVDELVAKRNETHFASNAQKARELVDLATLPYGDPTNTTWVRGDIPAAAGAHNALDALFDKVNEHYSAQATALNVLLGEMPHVPESSAVEQLQTLVDINDAGQHIVLDKLGKQGLDDERQRFQREILALLAPVRGREATDELASLPQFAASAARLRAHPDFDAAATTTTKSTMRALPRPDQDLAEFQADYRANAPLFTRLLTAFYENVHHIMSLPSILRYGEVESRRMQKRLVVENRANELRARIAELESQRLYEVSRYERRVALVRDYLEADAKRGSFEMYFARYHTQLLSLLLARDHQQEMLAVLNSGPQPREENFFIAYRTRAADELRRLEARMRLEDAELGGADLTPTQKLESARAEVADRLYESPASVKARLEQMRSLEGVQFKLDGKNVVVSGEAAALRGTLRLPTGQERTPEQRDLDRLTARAPPPGDAGVNVLADPVLTDGAAWKRGFKGELAPERVEMYFSAKTRVAEEERVAALPLLQAYVRSVGTINRSSLRGFGAREGALDVDKYSFEEQVAARLERAQFGETLSSIVLRLQLFSVDNARERADALLTQPTPSVLAKVPSADSELRRTALRAIDEILKTMRVETLSTVYRIGDTLSMLQYVASDVGDVEVIEPEIDLDVGNDARLNEDQRRRLLERRRQRAAGEQQSRLTDTVGRVRVAPNADLSDEQRRRLLTSIELSGREVLGSTQSDVVYRELMAAATERAALDSAAVSIDTSMRQFAHLDFAEARRALTGGSGPDGAPVAEKADDAAQLVYIGHRVPARLFDESLGDLIADIQFRANTTDASAANQAALDRIFESADCHIMRTFTRYELVNATSGRTEMYVDDVYRYTVAREAARLQLVDVFEQSSVTLTLRDPRTDAVGSRVLDRVVFGAPAGSLTDAQSLIDALRNETAAAAAGQPLLALVAALFVRARLTDTRPTPSSYIGVDDEVSMLQRLMALPRRSYRAFASLYDIAETFWYESNFSAQALLALAIAFANINYLVLLLGVAQALWPAFVTVLRSIGFVDALARLMFQALFKAARAIGVGLSWTLVARLLGIFEKLSWRHPRAGARRRELQLLRYYVAQMSAAALTPLDLVPSSSSSPAEAFIDRLYKFVIEFGSPARSGIARRTFDTMATALFAPLRALLAKIPQSVSGVVATAAWVASGESVSGSPFSITALLALNALGTVLLVWTLPACDTVWRSFARVFVTSIVTREAWRNSFNLVLRLYPPDTGGAGVRERALRGSRRALTVLSLIGPDLTSYLSGREFVVTDALQEAANAAYQRLLFAARLAWAAADAYVRGGAFVAPTMTDGALPHLAASADASTSSSVLRFIDRPSQAVESYVAFAGRFAGRTVWSVLRAGFEARRLATLTRDATRATQRRSRADAVDQALNGGVDDDEAARYVDDLDLNETLNNETSKLELQNAFFRRPSEQDLWFEIFSTVLDYNEQFLAINLSADYFGASVATRYVPTRPESFVVARNFVVHAARLRDELFTFLVFARLTFVLEATGGDRRGAERAFAAQLARHQATLVDANAGLLRSDLGEAMEFYDADADLHVEPLPTPASGVRVWRTFTVETTRFRELGVLVDRIERQLDGVRLAQARLRTSTDLGDDGKFVFIERVLAHFDARQGRDFIQLVDDVDVERFAQESLGFGEGAPPQ